MLHTKFHAKQPKFEPLYARKCQKRLKKPQTRSLARNFKHMTIFWDSNHFNKIYQIVLCAMFHAKQTKFELLYARKCKKRFKNLKNAT